MTGGSGGKVYRPRLGYRGRSDNVKPTKEQICALLYSWISQRPGLDYGNYGDPVAYRAEIRSIGKDLQHARQLLRAVELSGITGEELAEAFPRAFSGRLSLQYRAGKVMQWINVSDLPAGYPFADDSQFRLDYCTGQYWPTEYRRAACAVLSGALWAYKRDHCMPKGELVHNSETGETFERYNGKRAGDYLRDSFRREFGRCIASRWFD